MTLFKCSACSLVKNSRRIPAECITKDACNFLLLEEEARAGSAPLESALTPPVETSRIPVPPSSADARSTESIATIGSGASPEEAANSRRPTPDATASLTLHIGSQRWTLQGETVLGRNGDLAVESFRAFREVSRRHLHLAPEGAAWWLTNLSEHSPTRLNGQELSVRERRALPGGSSELLLGDCMTLLLVSSAPSRQDDGFPNPLARFQERRARQQAALGDPASQERP